MTFSRHAGTLPIGAFLAALTPAALATLPVHAQTATGNTGDNTVLPAVEVAGSQAASGADVQGIVANQTTTGTKTNTPVLETPQSVHVVTRPEMDQQNDQTVRTLLRYLPGVNAFNDTDNRLDYFYARGFLIDQYLDGLRLQGGTWAVPKVEPYMLNSAQLLLGPASVLYGQASPGGLLNMTSRLPTETTTHEVMLQGGTDGYVRTGLDFSGKLNEDGSLLGRVTGTAYNNGTQVKDQKEQRVDVAPSVTWKPDSDNTLTLQAGYLYDPHSGFWDQLPLQGTLLPNKYGPISPSFYVGDTQYEHFTRKQASLGYQFEHQFNDDWAFKQNFRYMNINTNYQEIQGSVLAADQQTMTRNAYSSLENLNTVALDNRVEGHFATGPVRQTLIGGFDYQYSNWHNFTRYGSAPTLNILAPNNTQAALWNFLPPPVFQSAIQTQNQLGLYAQDQLQLGGFNLLLAGREDWYTSDLQNDLTHSTTDSSARHFSGHAGLNYVFDVGIAPYISYSTSFQPVSGTSRLGTAFVPSTGEQVEGGIKYKPRGLNALFTLAAYNVTQNNVSTTDPVSSLYSVQTGQVRSRGVELSAVMSPLPGLNLRAEYTHLDNSITKTTVAGSKGNPIPGVPADTAALFAAYTIPDSRVEGLTVGGGVRYVGPTSTTVLNTYTVPGYTTFDALASYDLGQVSRKMTGATLSLNGTNILDKRYLATCGSLGCYYGLGRTIIGGINYKW